MLDVLNRIKNDNNVNIKFDMVVAHVNHMIRAEAGEDEKFVKEYLKRITACIGRYRYICVSTHAVLIDALADMKLSVVLVYPDLKLKREYIRRYLARENSYAYAKNIESTWHINLETLKHEVRFPAIVLSSGEYLLDWLPYLERIT